MISPDGEVVKFN